MKAKTLAEYNTSATTNDSDDDCDDCAALPDGWACADCYIKNGAAIEEARD